MKNKSIKELVDIYNEAAENLGESTRKSFRNKAEAVEKTEAMLEKLKAHTPGRKPKELVFPMPFRGIEHKVRPSSLRGKFLGATRKGTTEEDLQAIAEEHYEAKERKVPANIVRNTLNIMHSYNGYGFERNSGGIITVVEE